MNQNKSAAENKVSVLGNVKISVYKGKKKITQTVVKNNASADMFNLLYECLEAGLSKGFPGTGRCPARLGVKCSSTQGAIPGNFSVNLIASEIFRAGSNSGGKVVFSANILYTAFSPNSTTWNVTGFTLQDAGDNVLAEVELQENAIIIDSTQTTYSLLVDWAVGFANAGSN